MSTFLEKLRSARKTESVIKLRLKLVFSRHSSNIYAFFESTDDVVFYLHAIKRHCASEAIIHHFVCDGKRGVWHAHEFCLANKMCENSLFFVDRDLDDVDRTQLPSSNYLFMTNFYSIENYLCTKEGFDVIWCELIKLPINHPLYQKTTKRLDRGLVILINKLLPLFAWVIEMRRAKKDIVFGNLGNGLSSCMDVVDALPKAKTGFEKMFKNICNREGDHAFIVDVTQTIKELKSISYKQWLRGKFELWYFVSFCNAVWDELKGQHVSPKKKVKKSINIDGENIFNILSSKVEMPDGLDDYLLRILRPRAGPI